MDRRRPVMACRPGAKSQTRPCIGGRRECGKRDEDQHIHKREQFAGRFASVISRRGSKQRETTHWVSLLVLVDRQARGDQIRGASIVPSRVTPTSPRAFG